MSKLLRVIIILLIVGIVFTWLPNVLFFGSRYLKYHILLGLLIIWAYGKSVPAFYALDKWILCGLSVEIILSFIRGSYDFLRLGELILIYLGLLCFFGHKLQRRFFWTVYSSFCELILVVSLISIPLVFMGYIYEIPSSFGYEYTKEVNSISENYIREDHIVTTPLGVMFTNEERLLGIIGFEYILCGYSYEPHVAAFVLLPGLLYKIVNSTGRKRLVRSVALLIFIIFAASVTAMISLCVSLVVYNCWFRFDGRFIGFSLVFLLAFSLLAPQLVEAILDFLIFKLGPDSSSLSVTTTNFGYVFSLDSVLGGGAFTLPEGTDESGGLFALLFYCVITILVSFRLRALINKPEGLSLIYVFVHILKFPIQAFNYPLALAFYILLSRVSPSSMLRQEGKIIHS